MLQSATRQVARAARRPSAPAAKILTDARRAHYLLLADGPPTPEA
ncbi:hypothetical protein ACQPYH_06450 [Kribbella sp. CA-245084]